MITSRNSGQAQYRLLCRFLYIACTAEPRFNDLRFNDIPGVTINIRFPGKSYSKMYGAEPQFNDLRFNDILGF